MNNKLKAFVRYSEDDKVTPHSLVRMAGRPRIKGKYLEVHRLCCDPEYTAFIGAGRNRAFVQTDKQGNPLSGPIIRGFKPKNGYWLEIPFSLCCNPVAEPPVITVQPLDQEGPEGEFEFSVTATGSDLTYQWYIVDESPISLEDGVEIDFGGGNTLTPISGSTGPVLVVDSTFSTPLYVTVANSGGEVTSDTVTLTITP